MKQIILTIILGSALLLSGCAQSAPKVAASPEPTPTTPHLGMGYLEFTALCQPDALKGDTFNSLEFEGGKRVLVDLKSSPERIGRRCVGMFRFDDYKLTQILR